MKRAATIRDVAKAAGCGIATVSRVLNGSGAASAATRELVLEAAANLGFQFSEVGRALQSSRSRTIGCIVPSLANPIFADAVQGLQAELQRAGYQLLLICSDYDAETELAAVRTLLAKGVEALALTVCNAETSAALDLLRTRGLPFCLMFNRPAPGDSALCTDNEAAGRRVAEAFAALGHRATGFLTLGFAQSDRAQQRFAGFTEAATALGMDPPALIEVPEAAPDLPRQLSCLLDARADLSGIFASNDYLALATIRAARRLGRRVPQDLSIIGFDGIAIGEMVEPSLATIVTDPAAMGCGAGGHLIAALSGAAPRLPDTLDFTFRPGGSLAARIPPFPHRSGPIAPDQTRERP